ncbi:32 kDa beta-galactoside-binding lectin lec-3-like [Culex pipiens pallens]|uniref:32 kDa beta-galactoside-binding lectin lec-3-like n=1 Tax=Culex pipiens pallens TaxID=42434 RepID=UPI0019539D9F|nr:32 kDa beta-galactoside-binding lectin lec-3-like [Culex pipiens pallens]
MNKHDSQIHLPRFALVCDRRSKKADMVRVEASNSLPSFIECLPEGWGLNWKIIIRGKLNDERFDVNLQNVIEGPSDDEDTPLHISVRPGCEEIVCNAYEGGYGWGPEERQLGCAIETEANFEVEITVKPNAFGIWINGSHHADFTHRQPWEALRYVAVVGNVELEYLSAEQI